MKKILTIFMCLMFMMCFVGCSKSQDKIKVKFIFEDESYIVEIEKGTSINKDIIPLKNMKEDIELYYDEMYENIYNNNKIYTDMTIYVKTLKDNSNILEKPSISSKILKINKLNHHENYLKEHSDLVAFLKNYEQYHLISNINDCEKNLLDIFDLKFFELYDLGVFSIQKNDNITYFYDEVLISNYNKVGSVLEFNLKRNYSNISTSPEILENKFSTYVYFIVIPKSITLNVSLILINVN
ncbi:MAG: hypothetical protein IJB21_01300 [Bacilli bacterium]|nr:hypothetical protein [Bacilli bacterium]